MAVAPLRPLLGAPAPRSPAGERLARQGAGAGHDFAAALAELGGAGALGVPHAAASHVASAASDGGERVTRTSAVRAHEPEVAVKPAEPEREATGDLLHLVQIAQAAHSPSHLLLVALAPAPAATTRLPPAPLAEPAPAKASAPVKTPAASPFTATPLAMPARGPAKPAAPQTSAFAPAPQAGLNAGLAAKSGVLQETAAGTAVATAAPAQARPASVPAPAEGSAAAAAARAPAAAVDGVAASPVAAAPVAAAPVAAAPVAAALRPAAPVAATSVAAALRPAAPVAPSRAQTAASPSPAARGATKVIESLTAGQAVPAAAAQPPQRQELLQDPRSGSGPVAVEAVAIAPAPQSAPKPANGFDVAPRTRGGVPATSASAPAAEANTAAASVQQRADANPAALVQQPAKALRAGEGPSRVGVRSANAAHAAPAESRSALRPAAAEVRGAAATPKPAAHTSAPAPGLNAPSPSVERKAGPEQTPAMPPQQPARGTSTESTVVAPGSAQAHLAQPQRLSTGAPPHFAGSAPSAPVVARESQAAVASARTNSEGARPSAAQVALGSASAVAVRAQATQAREAAREQGAPPSPQQRPARAQAAWTQEPAPRAALTGAGQAALALSGRTVPAGSSARPGPASAAATVIVTAPAARAAQRAALESKQGGADDHGHEKPASSRKQASRSHASGHEQALAHSSPPPAQAQGTSAVAPQAASVAPERTGSGQAALPPSLAASVEADDSLRLVVLPNSANLRVTTPEGGDLSVHLRVRDGVTDVTVSGAGSEAALTHSADLRAALAGQGLTLGRIDRASAAAAGAAEVAGPRARVRSGERGEARSRTQGTGQSATGSAAEGSGDGAGESVKTVAAG